ncbi:MAG: DUF262 domain-containing protein [Acidobacteriota bacterium]|nr:MAG: DUF262 domain-containing protein [Acidobacteriota bacterium]
MEQTQSITKVVADIDAGYVSLPEFQRDFVWEITKTYDLFDSIVKDIFVGAIIYGIPSFEIAVREIDTRPKAQKGKRRPRLEIKTVTKEQIAERQRLNKSEFRLLLDGQQRTTALYRAIKGIDPVWFIAKDEAVLEKPFLESSLESLLAEFAGSEDPQQMSIRISDVWRMDQEDLDEAEIRTYFENSLYYASFSKDDDFDIAAEFKKYRYLKKKLVELFKQEKLLSFYLLDMSLEKFVVFFERSNTRGVQLNFIDILAAKLYTGNFNLKKKIEDFRDTNPNYDLSPETIVRAIAYITSKGKEVDRNYILSHLKASDFEDLWDRLTTYYRITLDFLYENSFIISQSWMPYENMLIPMMIFLNELGGDYHRMTQEQKQFLTYWYLNSIFSMRYSGASNERIIEDSTILTSIAKGNKISSASFFNKLEKSQVTGKEDLYGFEKKGNAIYKGILNLINFHVGGLINWNNDSKLSLNSELEDHHIFPKAYLEKVHSDKPGADLIDCVGNRTLVPKKLNIKISSQCPSEYLNKIKESNTEFEKTLENHLISKDLLTGELDDEYQFFLDLRIEEIFRVLQKHVFEPSSEIRMRFYEEPKIQEAANIKVFGTYHGHRVDASFNPASHKIYYKEKIFDSPSRAAIAVKTEFGAPADNTENGWTFWKFIDSNGEERKITEFREPAVDAGATRMDTQETRRFVETVLEREFDSEFEKAVRFRFMYESVTEMVYFQNSNMDKVLWYRIDEKARIALSRSDKSSFIVFTSPKEGIAFVIPMPELLKRIEGIGWTDADIEVHIERDKSYWRELDWDISAYRRQISINSVPAN